MTTEVVVSVPEVRGDDVMVEVIDLRTGKTLSENRVLSGQHARFYVHGGQDIRISEAAKVK